MTTALLHSFCSPLVCSLKPPSGFVFASLRPLRLWSFCQVLFFTPVEQWGPVSRSSATMRKRARSLVMWVMPHISLEPALFAVLTQTHSPKWEMTHANLRSLGTRNSTGIHQPSVKIREEALKRVLIYSTFIYPADFQSE